MNTKPAGPRPCKAKGCHETFIPKRPFEKWCSPACAWEIAKEKLAKKKASEAKIQRQKDRKARECLKTRSSYIKEAQRAFNAYIRERDKGKPCICCGQPLGAFDRGGDFDCGHYRSVGSAPHLRFDERNAHGQRKHCNRYGAGRAVDYRKGLIARLGYEIVEGLESDQVPKRYTVEDLKSIRDTYRTKVRELKKENS